MIIDLFVFCEYHLKWPYKVLTSLIHKLVVCQTKKQHVGRLPENATITKSHKNLEFD